MNYPQHPVGLHYATDLPTMDFETYSEAGYNIAPNGKVTGKGLTAVGTPVYAEHPSAEALCLFYDLKDGRGCRGWWPGQPEPVDLLAHIASGKPIAAWNVMFEFLIWNFVCVRRYGWPPLQIEQCHCDMAKARRWSMPAALGKAASVLKVEDKDKEGKRLIQKLSRPHTPTKNRPAHRWTPATAPEDFEAFYRYCGQDVRSESQAAARMPDLTEYERAIWLTDQRINLRGVQVDTETLNAALDILTQAEQALTLELQTITEGAVSSASAVAQMRGYLTVELDDLQAGTVRSTLARDDLAPDDRRVLEIRQALSSANVKKLHSIAAQINSDGRLRCQYQYCGADRTGRWSAGGVQLQNITSKGPKSKRCSECGTYVGGHHADRCPVCGWFTADTLTPCPEWTVDAVCSAVNVIRGRDLAKLTEVWGDPITLLCGCLRGLFVAKPGHDLVCCDFSAIEAVVLACVSGCQWRIEVFQTHGKIYEMSASKITGVPFEEFEAYKQANGMHHPLRKSIGKVAELASGYGGWIGAWKAFGADEHFASDEEIKKQILAWRAASPEIVEFWGGQFDTHNFRERRLFGLEGAFIQATLQPGQWVTVGPVAYGHHDGVTYCRLPSGRLLAYHGVELVIEEDRFGRGPVYAITFMGYNSNPTKGPVGWTRLDTYGGRLCENVVQAISADIQGEALCRLEAAGYAVVMHTHDEAVAEVPEGWGSVEEMAAIMSQRPVWADWWPIRAAGWRHKRYQKD